MPTHQFTAGELEEFQTGTPVEWLDSADAMWRRGIIAAVTVIPAIWPGAEQDFILVRHVGETAARGRVRHGNVIAVPAGMVRTPVGERQS